MIDKVFDESLKKALSDRNDYTLHSSYPPTDRGIVNALTDILETNKRILANLEQIARKLGVEGWS